MNLQQAMDYTRQNTGKHLLDSGDYYGRVYDTPVEALRSYFDKWGSPVINVTRLLEEDAELSEDHQEFYDSDYRTHEVYEFYAAKGFQQAARDNVYNNENDFDQVFIFEVYVPEEDSKDEWYYNDNARVVWYLHTGCDVRGGYSDPMFLEFTGNSSSEFCMPLDWQCTLYSEDLDEGENERLCVGYSSYPLGELEGMGFEFLHANEDGTAAFKHPDRGTITVHAEYLA